jgi:hypothetical protein
MFVGAQTGPLASPFATCSVALYDEELAIFAIGGCPAVDMYAQALCLPALTQFDPTALTIEPFDICRQLVASGSERVNI